MRTHHPAVPDARPPCILRSGLARHGTDRRCSFCIFTHLFLKFPRIMLALSCFENTTLMMKSSSRFHVCQVLNALAVDPGRTWKGVWRWFDEDKLSCCKPLSRCAGTPPCMHDAWQGDGRGRDIQPGRVSGALQRRARGGRAHGRPQHRARVPAARARDLGAQGRLHHRRLQSQRCACRPGPRASQCAGLEQTGDGHFSPVRACAARRGRV